MSQPPDATSPAVLYTLASNGMAHATRAVPMIERLARDFRVHVFCGGPAHTWLASRFPHVHKIRRFKAVYLGDHVSIPLVYANALATLPSSVWSMSKIAWFMARLRPVALITDFEALGSYAALFMRPFFKTNIVAFDNFCAARVAEPPFAPNPWEKKQLAKWQWTLKSVVPFADTFLVQSVAHPPLHHPRARYVPPPIRDEFLRYAGEIRTDGAAVVCLGGTRGFEWLEPVLQACKMPFHVYGFPQRKDVGLVSYRKFEEKEYIESLANAPFSIVRGISSAFDALALKKPVLVSPASGQFEHWYNGRLFESLGIGRLVENLSAESILEFHWDLDRYRSRLQDIELFDNDKVYGELERAVRAGAPD